MSTSHEVHIASLVVQFRQNAYADLVQYIETIPNAVLHEGLDNKSGGHSKFVVVVETQNAATITEIVDALSQRQGVLAVNLVYHHVDTEDALNEEIVQ